MVIFDQGSAPPGHMRFFDVTKRKRDDLWSTVRQIPTPLLILCAAAAACAGPSSQVQSVSSESPAPASTAEVSEASLGLRGPTLERQKVVALARGLLGVHHVALNGKRYSNDCSGFVRAVFDHSGIDLMSDPHPGDSGTQAIFRYTLRHGEVYRYRLPQPGDLVFFRDTYDKNRDARRNNGLTHVGIVESIDPDGTISVIHRVRRGVVRYLRRGAAHGPFPCGLLPMANEAPESHHDRPIHRHEVISDRSGTPKRAGEHAS